MALWASPSMTLLLCKETVSIVLQTNVTTECSAFDWLARVRFAFFLRWDFHFHTPSKGFVRLERTSSGLAWDEKVDFPTRLWFSCCADTTSSRCEDVSERVRKNREIDAHKSRLWLELFLSVVLRSESFDQDFRRQTFGQTSVDVRGEILVICKFWRGNIRAVWRVEENLEIKFF